LNINTQIIKVKPWKKIQLLSFLEGRKEGRKEGKGNSYFNFSKREILCEDEKAQLSNMTKQLQKYMALETQHEST
jgi:hypothetical protein